MCINDEPFKGLVSSSPWVLTAILSLGLEIDQLLVVMNMYQVYNSWPLTLLRVQLLHLHKGSEGPLH